MPRCDPENYYATRHLMPQEMLRRRVLDTNKTREAILSGWRNEELITEETEGEMLQRACEELLTMKNIVVMNDEAHHLPRESRQWGRGKADRGRSSGSQRKQRSCTLMDFRHRSSQT